MPRNSIDFFSSMSPRTSSLFYFMEIVEPVDRQSLVNEISELERRLLQAKIHLKETEDGDEPTSAACKSPAQSSTTINIHDLLVLSDSALPLGSFAFSAGLESFLAHLSSRNPRLADLHHFLDVSLSAVASSILPYVRSAFEDPSGLATLDNELDAATLCTCARRASITQGKALMTLWERSLRSRSDIKAASARQLQAINYIEKFCKASKGLASTAKATDLDYSSIVSAQNGHFGPLYGVVCAAVALSLDQCLYAFMLNHAKTVLSAAIRASVLGPYQSQAILAGDTLRGKLNVLIHDDLKVRTAPEDAAQIAPMLDIWTGRHEIVYSRIFNS